MKIFVFLLFFYVAAHSTPGFSQVINSKPLKLTSGFIHPQKIPQGANAEVTINMNLAGGHHAYLDGFELKIDSPQLQLGSFKVAPTIEFFDNNSKKTKIGIASGDASIKAVIEVPIDFDLGDYAAKFVVTYQACTEKYCLLPQDIEIDIPFIALSKSDNFGSVNNPIKSEFQKAFSKGLFYVFLIVFIAGFLTSLTPCIFPMIPITLAVLGKRSIGTSKLRGFLISLFYVLGIALTYSLLGLLAASTGYLFGSFLGSPIVAGVIALVFVLMALSMFGLYDIQPPSFVANMLKQKTQKGFAGAFIAGILAGVVASPCVGPVLISILTFVAQTKNHVLGFFLLFTFALGFGVLFMVLGTFSQLAHKLPKAGAWMNRVKFLFGLVMLGLALYYIYPVLPKTWLQNLPGQQQTQSAVPWVTYSQEALDKAKENKQGVIIDFYADWCLSCKELERFTFSQPDVQTYGENFVWLKFDATQESPEFNKLKEKYSIIGLPHIVFYNDLGEYLPQSTLTGFENKDLFLKRMKEVLKK